MPDTASNGTTSSSSSSSPKGWSNVMRHLSTNKIEAALWLIRIMTMVFSILYLLPFFGFNSYSCYQRALLSNAATSALRLHQRLPSFQFSRVFFSQLFTEDSAHYLFYSIIFLNTFPVTMALMPIFLFSMLHAASYSLTVLDQLGQNSWWGARLLISIVEFQQRNILRLIAFAEIAMMPTVIFMLLNGIANLLVPFIYYRFLCLRYSSRRNPYTRNVFYEMRMTVEHFISRPACPMFVASICRKAIDIICRLAPQIQTS